MARIRTVKPQLWAHEGLSALPPLAHMLAAALLNPADDAGYFLANPKLVAAATFPAREDFDVATCGACLEALARIGFVRLGTLPDGRRVGHLVTFRDHQRVDRPTASKFEPLAIRWDGDSRGLDEGSRVEPREPKAPPRGLADGSSQEEEKEEEEDRKGREGTRARGLADAAEHMADLMARSGSFVPAGHAEPFGAAVSATAAAVVGAALAKPPIGDVVGAALAPPPLEVAGGAIDPRRRRHAIFSGAASPFAYGVAHAGHVTAGFCGWMCFPEELAEQFAAGLAGAEPVTDAHRAAVLGWALDDMRAQKAAGVVPTGRMFDYWRERWAVRHGAGRSSDRRPGGGLDALAGIREAVAAVGGDE